MAYASLVSLAQILDQIFCHNRNRHLYNEQQIEDQIFCHNRNLVMQIEDQFFCHYGDRHLYNALQIEDKIFCGNRNRHLYNEQQIESLRERVGFLQEFIEDCDQRRIKVPQDLEIQMKNVAHLAEDVIETKMVDDILGISPFPREVSTLFYKKIEKLIQEFDSIQKMVMRMKEREGVKDDPRSRKTYSTSSPGLPPGGKIRAMVGLEEHLVRVMDELTGQQPKRRIFPIVGMGGIGKTTLCRSVFENPLIAQHFHVHAWVAVSQEYSVREIILRLLRQIRVPLEEEYQETTQRDDQLGEQLYKGLCGRKYLIAMDDFWSIEVWDEIKMFLPDNGNGSRVMVTTRILDVAHLLGSCSPYVMNFLDENESWSLLRQIVFGQESCSIELECIGKQIARNCQGLPLAIVVVSGLLSKSDMTREYWEYVAHHLSSIVNSESDEHCLNVLSLSYKQLPVHLKPCFLYMGIFPGDGEIRVSKLIKLWVAEGFLKPIMDKSLEEVAEDYLKDLIDRNLILVAARKSNGEMRSCSIHDLLRDLCIKESHKENFFWLIAADDSGINSLANQRDLEDARRGSNFLQNISRRISNFFCLKGLVYSSTRTPYSLKLPSSINDTPRRLVIPENRFKNRTQIHSRVKSASLTRSLFSESNHLTKDLITCFRLLRIVDHLNDYSRETITKVVNSRYVAFRLQPSNYEGMLLEIPPTINRLHNLQSLVVVSYKRAGPLLLPSAIWFMPHLRHIEIEEDAILPDLPRSSRDRSCYLNNLQTLSTIRNFNCDHNYLLNIHRNLKKLKISVQRYDDYHLNMLVHLQKLESLNCRGFGKISLGSQAFPDSIKKLTLNWLKLPWKNMSTIGCLPNLEVLKLRGAAYGKEWNTAEGGFSKLKFLLLESLDLRHWEAESSHFPRLESLIIRYCEELEEIPSGIGEIPTLKLIELYHCGEDVNSSAEKTQEDQRSLGNEDLQVRVKVKTAL